jgi:hypothetical protein
MADSLLDGTKPSVTKEDIIAKWKDKPQEELLAAKAESDLYIETLKARFDDLSKDYLDAKDQLKTGAQLKELLDRLDNPNKNTDNNSNDTDLGQVQPGMKPEDIQKLVDERYSAHQRALKQNENLSAMQAKLRETLGPEYQDAYKQRLDTLGLTPEFADDLAKNHPTVFIKTFGLDATSPQTQSVLPRNTQRPTTFAPQTPKRDWNYYQELKKTNPRLYLDPKIAVQMHNDAIELGDAFGMPEN